MQFPLDFSGFETIGIIMDHLINFEQLNLLIAIAVVGIYCIMMRQTHDNHEFGGLREFLMIALGTTFLVVAYYSIPTRGAPSGSYIYSEFFSNWGTELVFIAPWVMIKITRLMADNPKHPNLQMRNGMMMQLVATILFMVVCVYVVFNIDTLTQLDPHMKLIYLNIAIEGFTFPTTLLLIITIETIIYLYERKTVNRTEVIGLLVLIGLYTALALPFMALSYRFEPLTYATIGGLLTIIIFIDPISTAMVGSLVPFRWIFYVSVVLVVFYLLSGFADLPDLIAVGFSAELLGALVPFFLITKRERYLTSRA